MRKKYLTNSSIQTKKLGQKFAREVLKEKPKNRAFVIGLEGELGGGKTTFLQGFARGLGIKEKILSPTFVIMKKFQIPNFKNFYHIDCYRIEKAKELSVLGFKEIVSNPQNIVVIEWADHIREIISKNAIWIKFEFVDEKKRKITIKNLKT